MNMKRRILCLFSLVLYLMAACTILSAKIEEEMTTLVQIERKTSSKRTGRSMELNSRSLFIDETGDHLYEVKEGTGWEIGLRAYEVPSFGLDVMASRVSLYGVRDYVFVRSASRQPQDGELAVVVEEFETIHDQVLLYYEDGIPKVRDFPAGTELIGETETAFLLDVPECSSPFFPHAMKTQAVVTDMADRIISLTEAERFLNELPKVVKVVVILIAGMILWGVSCFLGFRTKDHKILIWLNIGLVAVLLFYLQYTLGTIDFPASMLPRDNILDFAHYQEVFDIIGGCMESVPETLIDVAI